MQFKPNFDLFCDWDKAKRAKDFACNSAFVAVFRRDNKTLVYMGDKHRENVSFDMVDMCFADDFGHKPDVLLTEMENANYEWKFGYHGFQTNTLLYAAVVATERNIPVVFADLSDRQMIDVINAGFPNSKITDADLHKVLRAGPTGTNIYQQMCEYLNRFGRNRFMLQNIAEALNRYDTVFVIFGAGHYEEQRLVLEDMMGKPEYITKIKNMRGDFSDVKIEPIKLCEFEMVKDDDKKS